MNVPSWSAYRSSGRTGVFGDVVGESAGMREFFAKLAAIARSSRCLLLLGESGTGKEALAREVHAQSDCARRAFVVLDCLRVADDPVSSTSWDPGSTADGTVDAYIASVLRSAAGGTIFVDGIDRLPLRAQGDLLRGLGLGGSQQGCADVPTRVIAAACTDLEPRVSEGTFRRDLYHALATFCLRLPPLRERLEDLPCLLRQYCERRGIPSDLASRLDLEPFRRHPWSGNIRELHGVLDRWRILGGDILDSMRVAEAPRPLDPRVDLPFSEAKARWIEEFERRYVALAFARAHNNITHAAVQSGLSRRHFRTLLEQHGLRGGSEEPDEVEPQPDVPVLADRREKESTQKTAPLRFAYPGR